METISSGKMLTLFKKLRPCLLTEQPMDVSVHGEVTLLIKIHIYIYICYTSMRINIQNLFRLIIQSAASSKLRLNKICDYQ